MPSLFAAFIAVITVSLASSAAAVAAEDPGAALATFGGSWRCGAVPWTFARQNGAWVRVTYGDPADPGGIATFGYVSALGAWVYRDFHSDGSYADLSSPGPRNGSWDFSGTYYPAGGAAIAVPGISWVVDSPNRFHRVFRKLENGKAVDAGGDVCAKQPG